MIRWSFRPRARHPLARLIAGVLGAAALLVLIAFGLFAAAALVVGGAVVLLVKALMRPSPAVVSPAPGCGRRRDRGRIQGRQRHAQPDRTLRKPSDPPRACPPRGAHATRAGAATRAKWPHDICSGWAYGVPKPSLSCYARRSLARPLRMDTQ